ncbi:GOS12 [Symbiodinium necroappetens]|uniref:GOS12 protein n=1 Tax=Symbiodinium necroappetens TaxID=1628268 RepID=A0A812NIQ2_9DINO|nr:GOS12 [Symbiodinium necroappetens]
MILRTCEAVGIQAVWLVPPPSGAKYRATMVRSRHASRGAERFLTLRRFTNVEEVAACCKVEARELWASYCPPRTEVSAAVAVPLVQGSVPSPLPRLALVWPFSGAVDMVRYAFQCSGAAMLHGLRLARDDVGDDEGERITDTENDSIRESHGIVGALKSELDTKMQDLGRLNKRLSTATASTPADRVAELDGQITLVVSLREEVEKGLSQLEDASESLANVAATSAQAAQAARFRETHQEMLRDFKRVAQSIDQQYQHARLLPQARNNWPSDDAEDGLMRERMGLNSSLSMADDIIGQATATRDMLMNQRNEELRSLSSEDTEEPEDTMGESRDEDADMVEKASSGRLCSLPARSVLLTPLALDSYRGSFPASVGVALGGFDPPGHFFAGRSRASSEAGAETALLLNEFLDGLFSAMDVRDLRLNEEVCGCHRVFDFSPGMGDLLLSPMARAGLKQRGHLAAAESNSVPAIKEAPPIAISNRRILSRVAGVKMDDASTQWGQQHGVPRKPDAYRLTEPKTTSQSPTGASPPRRPPSMTRSTRPSQNANRAQPAPHSRTRRTNPWRRNIGQLLRDSTVV